MNMSSIMFRKEARAFMDEFRVDAYRKDGSLEV